MAATEFICAYCGAKVLRGATSGRPMPGSCPRKPKDPDGSMKPHSWRINRRLP